MSRYTILVILNLPLIIAAIMKGVVSYKLGRTSRRQMYTRIGLWLAILAGLIFAEPIYGFLFSRNLTQTEPLSLFDVIQITGIIAVLFIANQAHSKADILEQRVQDLHREISIKLSDDLSEKD